MYPVSVMTVWSRTNGVADKLLTMSIWIDEWMEFFVLLLRFPAHSSRESHPLLFCTNKNHLFHIRRKTIKKHLKWTLGVILRWCPTLCYGLIWFIRVEIHIRELLADEMASFEAYFDGERGQVYQMTIQRNMTYGYCE